MLHCDKYCHNVTINVTTIVTMLHHIAVYSTSCCDIKKLGFIMLENAARKTKFDLCLIHF